MAVASAQPAAVPRAFAPPRRAPLYGRALREIRRDPIAVAGLAVLAVVIFAAVFGPWLTPADPTDQELAARLRPPAWLERGTAEHLLGTDQLGRDILSRVIVGARVSVVVGLAVILVAGIIGTALGVTAGYFGGKLDSVLIAIIDVVLAFPSLLLALTVVAVLGPNLVTLVLALTFRAWVVYARVARGQSMSLRQYQFVEAARTIGATVPRVLLVHVFPNLIPSLMTIAVLELARVVLAESSLSFLGLGVQPPGISWGLMLAEGRNYMLTANWLVTLPGVLIAATVLSVNVLASHARRVVDPFQRGRGASEE
ncbi:MAG: ABC transporter permease [Chloroflexota bacterium]